MENAPRVYDLRQSQEQYRLMRELRGYMDTCRMEHHGTDRSGRQFALDALNELVDGKYEISFRKSI